MENHGGGNKVDLEIWMMSQRKTNFASRFCLYVSNGNLSIKYQEIPKNLAHHGLSPQKLLYYHWWPDSPCSPWRRQHLKQGSASEKTGCEVAVILERTSEDQPSLIYIYIPFYSWCTNLYTLRKVDVRELILKLKQTQHVGGLHLTNPMLLYISMYFHLCKLNLQILKAIRTLYHLIADTLLALNRRGHTNWMDKYNRNYPIFIAYKSPLSLPFATKTHEMGMIQVKCPVRTKNQAVSYVNGLYVAGNKVILALQGLFYYEHKQFNIQGGYLTSPQICTVWSSQYG